MLPRDDVLRETTLKFTLCYRHTAIANCTLAIRQGSILRGSRNIPFIIISNQHALGWTTRKPKTPSRNTKTQDTVRKHNGCESDSSARQRDHTPAPRSLHPRRDRKPNLVLT